MLDFLVGKVVSQNKEYIGLDVNNIGFKIYTNHTNSFVLTKEYTFYVSDLIKENEEIVIYGFTNLNELKMFNKLISVNGVGSKTAFNLLNNLTIEQLLYLITNRNRTELASVPGVGNKAGRIIEELDGKLKDFDSNGVFEYSGVFKALKTIGYKPSDISRAISKIPGGLSDSEAINLAVKEIGKKHE